MGCCSIRDVSCFGAKGDGTTDDTQEIQAALNVAQPGDTVYFPGPSNYYRVTAPLTVPAGVTLAGEGAQLRQVSSNNVLLSIAGDNVTVRGLNLVGPQFAVLQAEEKAISCVGASSAAYRTGIRVLGCRFSNWGRGAIWLQYVEDFTLNDNDIQDCYYDGVLALSVRRGLIQGNHITNITGSPQAYGIALTRNNSNSLTTEPRSSDVSVVGNVVSGVTNWEGIDTHGGERIAIQGNAVHNCRLGIAVVPADNASNVETFAPRDITVIGNTVASGVTNGSRSYGIVFTGAQGPVGSPVDLASGAIVGNTVRGYGDEDVDTVGAITVFVTRGVSVNANVVIEASPHGVILYFDNYGFSCEGNIFVDPWSNAIATSGPIRVRSEYNFGTISGNVVARGSKSATYIFATGIRLDTATNVAIALGLHDLSLATTPISQSASGGLRLGFYGSNPVAKPTVTGSRGGNAALASLLTALASQGLITNSTT
jgi:hypothetical protein